VHYVSDVVAGWIVALACLAGTVGAFEIWRREQGHVPSTVSEGVDPEAGSEISDATRGDDDDLLPRTDAAPPDPPHDSPATGRRSASTSRE
jgi:undecaprenyl-diphosphatase